MQLYMKNHHSLSHMPPFTSIIYLQLWVPTVFRLYWVKIKPEIHQDHCPHIAKCKFWFHRPLLFSNPSLLWREKEQPLSLCCFELEGNAQQDRAAGGAGTNATSSSR